MVVYATKSDFIEARESHFTLKYECPFTKKIVSVEGRAYNLWAKYYGRVKYLVYRVEEKFAGGCPECHLQHDIVFHTLGDRDEKCCVCRPLKIPVDNNKTQRLVLLFLAVLSAMATACF